MADVLQPTSGRDPAGRKKLRLGASPKGESSKGVSLKPSTSLTSLPFVVVLTSSALLNRRENFSKEALHVHAPGWTLNSASQPASDKLISMKVFFTIIGKPHDEVSDADFT
jgi:hypothetical protein